MRNREAILRKIDQIDSSLNKMSININHGNRELFLETVEKMREQLEQLKIYIDSEPIINGELNPN